MKKIAIILGCSLLASCATMQGGATKVGNTMCKNKESAQLALVTTIQNATLIENPIVRQSVIGIAQATLAALAECPVTGVAANAADAPTN